MISMRGPTRDRLPTIGGYKNAHGGNNVVVAISTRTMHLLRWIILVGSVLYVTSLNVTILREEYRHLVVSGSVENVMVSHAEIRGHVEVLLKLHDLVAKGTKSFMGSTRTAWTEVRRAQLIKSFPALMTEELSERRMLVIRAKVTDAEKVCRSIVGDDSGEYSYL